MTSKTSTRDAAVSSLLRCESRKRYSNLELSAAIEKYGFSNEDKALFTRLVYGVIERRITLDHAIGRFSDIPPEKIDPDILMILRAALYQIYFLDRIPVSAAVNEAVGSAKRRKKSAAGFVNAVLRNAVRHGRELPYPDGDGDDRLSVRYSIPEWMISAWRDQYGGDICGKILDGVDRVPYTTVAVNTLKTAKEILIQNLTGGGCEIEATDSADRAVQIKNGFGKAARDAVSNGECYVQDLSSQRAVTALDPRPDDILIDVCACPGGKSFYSALLMENCGVIISRDLHENKLSLIKSGAERLGIDIIRTEAADASVSDPAYESSADRVICDVPCSGLGVIAKKPDLRHKSPEDLVRLPEIQSKILASSAKYLKPGGRLLYSTCTLNKDENERVVEMFLSGHPGYSLIEEKTFLPGVSNDGFFYAIMEKE